MLVKTVWALKKLKRFSNFSPNTRVCRLALQKNTHPLKPLFKKNTYTGTEHAWLKSHLTEHDTLFRLATTCFYLYRKYACTYDVTKQYSVSIQLETHLYVQFWGKTRP